MTDLLLKLLELRTALQAARDLAEGYGYLAELPEIEKMQKLERRAFEKVNKWSEPE